MRNPMPPASADVVLRRSAGACERCGSRARDIHHRKPRGMGGTSDEAIHDPVNLLHLCRRCHDWVEQNRAVAYAHGWLVHRYNDPAAQAVYRWGDWWVVTPDALVLMQRFNDPPF